MPRLKPGARARSSSASSRLKRPRLASSSSVPVPGDESAKKEKSVEEMIEDEDLEDTDEDSDHGLVDDGSSDDSEDDAPRNRIGNVPLEWYKDEDHVGYDIAGEKIMRTLSTSEINALLESKDNPDAWRTIKDHKNQREVVLTETDLEVIRRIRERMYPSLATDTTEMVEFENPEARIHPEGKAHPPKSRFLPSKWERMKVKRLVSLLRQGKIRPPPPPAPEVWDLWADEAQLRRKAPTALPAPKMALPGHAESYNPPSEYLFTEEEKKEWEETFEEDRTLNHLPQKFESLRHVPGYKDFTLERFKRCLDLYLVPRALKQRMNVDPESLLPKLPNPKDLRPFPTHIAVSYEGHEGMIRSVAVEATGRYLATASSDETLRIWEVATGRPVRSIKFSSAVTAVAWNPQHLMLSVSAEENVFFLDPQLEIQAAPDGEAPVAVSSLLEFKEANVAKPEGEEVEEPTAAKAKAVHWRAVQPDSPQHAAGCRLSIATDGDVQLLVWHHKGNYCAAVSPKARATSNQCIIHALNQQKSMRPFARLRGGQQVQSCAFHPSKPHFLVATMRSVRIYDLQKQAQVKQLISGAKWISSVTVHPTGDHVVVGSYDRRVVWWDLDFASKPYKTLQYHDKAVRCATFHPGKFPLLAACSDDATVSILHAKVFSDLMQSPMIVPVKRLRDHMVNQGFGVLSCAWHPHQPWLFTAGADGRAYLWA
ncbi:unnamed protein product [Durusdinium trenchii]|uniref:Ribosome biogenesis protein bop1-B (Block of proliferation 1 protein B) n=2 Tax=Durusdinium trenchii TaxID=1381693 RepID=A0ABP0R5M7_9DINO